VKILLDLAAYQL